MATVSIPLRKIEGLKLQWTWFVLFCVARASHEWLSLVAHSFGDTIPFVLARAFVTFVAFFCLIEFGRSGVANARGRGVGRWILVGLVGIPLLGWSVAGLTGVEIALRFLGALGCLWAALAVALVSRERKGLGWTLLRAGAPVLVLAAIAMATTPQATLLSPALFGADRALQTVGFFLGLPLAVLGICVATGVWIYAQAASETGSSSPRSQLVWKPTMVAAALIAALVLLGGGFTEGLGRYGDEQSRDCLLARAQTAASAMNPVRVKHLTGTQADLGTADHERLRVQLLSIRNANPDIRFVYLMGLRGHKIIFLVDAEPPTSKDYSPPGQVYADATPELLDRVVRGQSYVTGPVSDAWGTWISATVPVMSQTRGRPIAVLGIDVVAERLVRTNGLYRLFGIVITLGLSVITIAFFMAWQQSKESAARLRALQMAELEAANQMKLENITSTLGEGVFVIDAEGSITFVNPEAERLLGWRAGELLGTFVYDSVPCCAGDGRQPPRSELAVFKTIETGIGRRADDATFTRKDGMPLPVSYISTPLIEDGDIAGSVVAFQDITGRKQAENTIRRMAYRDALTTLPNRALFNDRLTMALAHAHRNKEIVAVLFLDLDRFKAVNDTLGHAIGDELLKAAALRLRDLVREGDTVARLGGDEFTLLLPQLGTEEDASTVAGKVLETLRVPFSLNGHEIHATASVGVAIYPDSGHDVETLLRNADIAMYRAKEQGRNNYQLYTQALKETALGRLALETRLRPALEHGEFLLHYQPQVSIDSGEIVGTEALLRWEHPERGLIGPAEFVPIAEESGLILPIADWVLRTACAQNKAWQETGYRPMRIAVNLSARQFQKQDLVERVTEVLEETGLDPHFLELEITESIAMENADVTIRTLNQLVEMGIRIAIDDFGTGYSSLNSLKHFPVHTLKIAQTFVRDVTINADAAAIATTVLVLAQNLGLNAIAEGVETAEQLEFLRKRHCNEMQGYLFSWPLPPEEIPRLLRPAPAVATPAQ